MYTREREKSSEEVVYHMNVGKLPNKFCVEIHNLEQGEIIKESF